MFPWIWRPPWNYFRFSGQIQCALLVVLCWNRESSCQMSRSLIHCMYNVHESFNFPPQFLSWWLYTVQQSDYNGLFSLRRMHMGGAQPLALLFQLIVKEAEETILEVILMTLNVQSEFQNRSLQFWCWSGVSGDHIEECEEKNPSSRTAAQTASGSHWYGIYICPQHWFMDVDLVFS